MAYATHSQASGIALGERLRGTRESLADRWARYRVFRQTQNELAALTDRDLADLGVSRGQIRSLALEAAYGK